MEARKKDKLSMTEKEKDNIYYVCTLLEYLSRKTHNDRKTIIEYFSKQDVEHLLYVAEVNHCLSFDQVSDELIEDFQIQSGNYDAETECKHTTSSVTSVGAAYQKLVLEQSPQNPAQGILDVFSS